MGKWREEIQKKSTNKVFQQYLINGKKIIEMIQDRKEKYFYDLSLKLNKPQNDHKTYCSIIESCYDGRKIPIILPLSVNGKIVTNFNLFNRYFLSQCNPLPKESKLPENQIYITEAKVSSFDINDKDI